jgi:hypothetical protein
MKKPNARTTVFQILSFHAAATLSEAEREVLAGLFS